MTIARQRDRLLHDVREAEFEDILIKVTPLYLRHLKGYYALRKYCENQIKRAPPTQH
jgi:hypothetical protein